MHPITFTFILFDISREFIGAIYVIKPIKVYEFIVMLIHYFNRCLVTF